MESSRYRCIMQVVCEGALAPVSRDNGNIESSLCLSLTDRGPLVYLGLGELKASNVS